jgi:hypothetical protein
MPGKHSTDPLQQTAVLGISDIMRKVLQSETWRLRGGDHRWFNRSTGVKRPVTRDNEIIATTIIISMLQYAYLVDVAIPNSHNLHSTITEKLQNYTDLTERLVRIWQLKTAYIMPLVLSTTGIIPNKLHESLKLLNLRPVLHILMLKAVILNTCRIIRNYWQNSE